MLEDLGQIDLEKGSEKIIYTIQIPKDSDAMHRNLANKTYSGKLVLKEICLFSDALAISPFICVLIALLRLPIPYVFRYLDH